MEILHNPIREYAWGSKYVIPNLLGTEFTGLPQAEIWFGAHQDFSSEFISPTGDSVKLIDAIASQPLDLLGNDICKKFDSKLPFLLKILAIDKPLSLQVHPNKVQAVNGYMKEEKFGILKNSPHRNYKDSEHKPEMIYALTDFQALCGFRDPKDILDIFKDFFQGISDISLCENILKYLENDVCEIALEKVFREIIRNHILTGELTQKIRYKLLKNASGRYLEEKRTFLSLSEQYPNDPGTLLALMLNRVSLNPGESMYVPARTIHAYLCGTGVEIMAPSDNVLRGGLTEKHIDIPQLVEIVDFSISPIAYIFGQKEGQIERFVPPIEEFLLEKIVFTEAEESVQITQNGPVIILVLEGEIVIRGNESRDKIVHSKESIFVPAKDKILSLEAITAATLFAVTAGNLVS